MWWSNRPVSDPGAEDSGPTPEEEAALQERLDRVAEEKRRALDDPGLSWRDWFLFDAAKWFVGLGFLIGDVLVVGTWLQVHNYIGMGLSLVAAVYGEFLVWRLLWYRPVDHTAARRRAFRPGPFRLAAIGRWTPEAEEERSGGTRVPTDHGPDLRDFF